MEFSGRYYGWSFDSQKLVLAKRASNRLRGYPFYDTYLIDLGELIALRKNYVTDFQSATDDKTRQRLTKTYIRKKSKLEFEAERISKSLRSTHVTFSKDGKRVLFSENQDGRRDLKWMNLDGSDIQDLVAIGGDAEATEAVVSPDGSHVAFTLFNHDQADIWLLTLDSKELRPLTFDKADDRQPVFSPDGQHIIFSSDRTGIFQIYRMPLAGGGPTEALTNVETGSVHATREWRWKRTLICSF